MVQRVLAALKDILALSQSFVAYIVFRFSEKNY